ncbi:MAG: TIGR04282 family arsenosugar biosynthesis glycosyltransferase [Pseudomonadota bacterium]|nr:TIGR04282 family arsenosugar biosynthesis glycosyltransferase [Pseudomonadota bacterium]
MTLQRHLFIFTKIPLLGTSKTRLATDIGQAKALRFSRNLTQKLYRLLSADRRWCCHLALTPDALANTTRVWPQDGERVLQGPGGLGKRMEKIAREKKVGPLIIVGGDIPGINKQHIQSAFKALGNHNFVIGPAADGGFWLIGMKRRPINSIPFNNIQWSTSDTLRQTLNNIKDGMKVKFLEELEDVDDGPSWKRWRTNIDNKRLCSKKRLRPQ